MSHHESVSASQRVQRAHVRLHDVSVLFQPIVHLASQSVIGYEALARGPVNTPVERPDQLFAAARERGVTDSVDWACRIAAFQAALDGHLTPPLTLFVNVEPDVIASRCPPEFDGPAVRRQRELRRIYEITERALTDRPAELLHMVEEIRRQGSGIALDDIGVDWRSLALLPFIRPDVIKLDRHLIQSPLTTQGAIVGEAVRAFASQTGARIIAEGIENETHLQRALGLGATFGQGWMFGRPAPLPRLSRHRFIPAPELVIAHQPADDGSPFEAIATRVETAVAPKADLLALSHAIEQRAVDTTEPCVILTTFESSDRFTSTEAELYATLAQRSAFVGVFGPGMPPEPVRGVRGADHDLNHHLGEWTVALVSPHYAVALVAQNLGDRGRQLQRRYRYAILNDRDLVLRAARALMRRTHPVVGDDQRYLGA